MPVPRFPIHRRRCRRPGSRYPPARTQADRLGTTRHERAAGNVNCTCTVQMFLHSHNRIRKFRIRHAQFIIHLNEIWRVRLPIPIRCCNLQLPVDGEAIAVALARSSASCAVNATREKVWALISRPDQLKTWVPNHDFWIGEVPATFTLGVTVRAQATITSIIHELDLTVTECLPPERLELSGIGLTGNHFTYSISLAEARNSPTVVTLETRYTGAPRHDTDYSAIMPIVADEMNRSAKLLAAQFPAGDVRGYRTGPAPASAPRVLPEDDDQVGRTIMSTTTTVHSRL
ncbi:SRPBCC family protein [Nocardia cyriacigeorgica]|uniref:SRPBCC family protein n=1 Tax=Nocardia cyriacigeorgica TaxID=135487 RepID=UPI002B4B1219|nr:SRPBCC family protein [Nocardia cyriacigeorgica]